MNFYILKSFLFLLFPSVLFAQTFEVVPIKNKADSSEIPDFGFDSLSSSDSLEECFQHTNAPMKRQRWSMLISVLLQDAPMSQFLTNTEYMSLWHKPWHVNHQSSMGFSVGFGYDLLFATYYVFRVQGELETTGWISGVIDIGFGIRLPSLKTKYFNIQLYCSIMQTGDTLYYRGNEPNVPQSIYLYMAFFGIKVKISYDFPLAKQYFISPYLSYAAYPGLVYNQKKSHSLNRSHIGNILDSLQIGFEFGRIF